jgi:hypothetical protein
MTVPFNRRQFIGSLAALPFALEAAIEAQRVPPEEAARLRAEVMSPFPVIDTHIHIFDKSRPGGMGYPRAMPGGGEPPQGHIALPNRFKLVADPYGVVGAVIVEAAATLQDNYWLLDAAATARSSAWSAGSTRTPRSSHRTCRSSPRTRCFWGFARAGCATALRSRSTWPTSSGWPTPTAASISTRRATASRDRRRS